VVHACHPCYSGAVNRRVEIQTSLGKNARTYPKITKAKNPTTTKMAGDMTQVVEHLLSKLKTLSSNPSTRKKKCEGQCTGVQTVVILPQTE
jgi:hypothetical protein